MKIVLINQAAHLSKRITQNPYQSRYKQWIISSNISEKISVLINDSKHILNQPRIFNSQKRILSNLISHLETRNIPIQKTEDITSFTNNPFLELNHILTKIYSFNESLYPFVVNCILTGEHKQLLRFINDIRKNSIDQRVFSKGQFILDIKIYNSILIHFADIGNVDNFNLVFSWIKSDGLSPDLTSYLTGYHCYGQLLNSNQTIGPQNMKKLLKLHEEATHLFSDIQNNFLSYPHKKNSLSCIIRGWLHVSDVHPKLSFVSNYYSRDHSNPFTLALSEIKFSANDNFNPITSHSSIESAMEKFDQQLDLERKINVEVKPIFPILGGPSQVMRTPKLNYHKILVQERCLWEKQLLNAFLDTLSRLQIAHNSNKITSYPYLKILKPIDYVKIMIRGIDSLFVETSLGFTTPFMLSMYLGENVEYACKSFSLAGTEKIHELRRVYQSYLNTLACRNDDFKVLWCEALQENIENDCIYSNQEIPWGSKTRRLVGKELYQILFDNIRFNLKILRDTENQEARSETPILYEVDPDKIEIKDTKIIQMHPTLIKLFELANYPPLQFKATELPTICPPIPRIDNGNAGYLIGSSYSTKLIRKSTHGQGSELASADFLDFDPESIPEIYQSLNILSSLPWKVNNEILDNVKEIAKSSSDKNLSIIKPTPKPPPYIKNEKDVVIRKEKNRQIRLIHKEHDESRSIWASILYNISIANSYKDEVFYFPHSMDFRGRVYPCPPHFNHMGNDLSRGILKFCNSKPLGDKGMDWLMIHLANLTGVKKSSSNADRLAYANSILSDIIDSAEKPLDGRRWWREQEEPWQVLAACFEIAKALKHPEGVKSFHSNLPVHQDGSCNGLQHYAALGRDLKGAESVNLVPFDLPQDVYSCVVEIVEEQRKLDAENGNEVAIILDGFVKRKIIKQSIMTTVYGVTMYGATLQIKKQLKDLDNFPRPEMLHKCSSYLARTTLESISKIFTSSASIQKWFVELAYIIARDLKCRVSWVTPLGLPVIQPYVNVPSSSFAKRRQTEPESPKEFSKNDDFLLEVNSDQYSQAKRISLQDEIRERHHSADSLVGLPPPHVHRQKNAFPPNFIHSLDSCHMMLTSLQCARQGVTFAAVHDCFWTHPSTVDEMNDICREQFIALHSQPILENLAEHLREKFNCTTEYIDSLPDTQNKESLRRLKILLDNVPTKGIFDLSQIQKSTYFFS